MQMICDCSPVFAGCRDTLKKLVAKIAEQKWPVFDPENAHYCSDDGKLRLCASIAA